MAMHDLAHLDFVTLNDADVWAQTLRPDWEFRCTHLGKGLPHYKCHQVSFSDVELAYLLESHPRADHYRIPDGWTVFALLSPMISPLRWCGIEVAHNVLAINPCGRDYFAASASGYEAVELLLSNELVAELDILPDRLMLHGEISQQWLIPLVEPAGSQLRQWLEGWLASEENSLPLSRSPMEATLFRDRLLHELSSIVQQGLAQRNGHRRMSPNGRLSLVRRAVNLIDDQLKESTSAGQLARDLGVSPRVLQYAFADVLGTSPHRYVLVRKLQAVRRDLSSVPRTSGCISQTALSYGFTELGRFSGRYRQTFGELPSETLQNGTRVVPAPRRS